MLIQKKYYEFLQNKNLLVAVSGGVDSMTLLFDLLKLKEDLNIGIEICHFDHLTRNGMSTKDKEFVENFAKSNNLICHTDSYSMEKYSKDNDLSIEESGRILRKNFFEKILQKNKDMILLLAHNLDDNIETLLMRIIRGTGLRGLEGIKEYEKKEYYSILRPYLEISKEKIIEYASINNIEFRQDNTNFENIYTRNKIRNELIPLLKENYNIGIYESIKNLSDISRSNNHFVDIQISKVIDEISIDKNKNYIMFDSNKLSQYSDYEKVLIIRKSLDNIHNNYNFTNNHYDEILKIINSKKGIDVVINGIVFYNSFNNFVIRKVEKNDLCDTIFISSPKVLYLNNYKISIDNLDRDIKIRKRKNGDKIKVKNSYKKLKDFLIDKKIDKYLRDYIPIIEIDKEIKFVGEIYNSKIENIKINIERIENEQ